MKPEIKKAFDIAYQVHHNQRRKTGNTPYISHVMQVAAMVMQYGGDDNTAMAALLHDTIEDSDGAVTHQTIAQAISKPVADLVLAVTDTDTHPRPGWHERKRLYLQKISSASKEAMLICACDKLHNLESLWHDYQLSGSSVWQNFNAGPEESLKFYTQVIAAIEKHIPDQLKARLQAVLKNLQDTV